MTRPVECQYHSWGCRECGAELPENSLVVPQGGGVCHLCLQPDVEAIRAALDPRPKGRCAICHLPKDGLEYQGLHDGAEGGHDFVPQRALPPEPLRAAADEMVAARDAWLSCRDDYDGCGTRLDVAHEALRAAVGYATGNRR